MISTRDMHGKYPDLYTISLVADGPLQNPEVDWGWTFSDSLARQQLEVKKAIVAVHIIGSLKVLIEAGRKSLKPSALGPIKARNCSQDRMVLC